MIFRSTLAITIIAIASTFSYTQKILTDHTADDRYPRWSPDANHIVFESNRDGNWNIYVMKSDGSERQQITTDPSDDRFPTWHPNGQRVLFSSKRSGRFELYEADISGGTPRPISLNGIDADVLFADYSPDGRHIAFTSQANLHVAAIDDGHVTQITFDSARSLFPVWSFDGSMLAFFSRRDTSGETDEIYIHDLASKTSRRVTHWPTHNFAPSWSAGGQFLICATSVSDSRPELYVIDVQSGALERVTTNDYGDTEPDWSPKGNTAVYACQQAGNYDICLLPLDDYLSDPNDQ